MRNDHSAEIYRALQNEAADCPVKAFAELLRKFKNDPKAVATMQTAVRHKMRGEDCGSHCVSASPDYYPTVQKQEMLDKYFLNQPLDHGVNLSAEFANAAFTVMLQKVATLGKQVAAYEEGDLEKLGKRVNA